MNKNVIVFETGLNWSCSSQDNKVLNETSLESQKVMEHLRMNNPFVLQPFNLLIFWSQTANKPVMTRLVRSMQSSTTKAVLSLLQVPAVFYISSQEE